MKIIPESRLVHDPETNTEKYVDGYFLTKIQLIDLATDAMSGEYDYDIVDWIKRYNDKSE